MDKILPYYSILDKPEVFFTSLKKGDLFKYSGIYSFNNVKNDAEKMCFIIKKTKDHCIAMIVDEIGNKENIFHFDESTLFD